MRGTAGSCRWSSVLRQGLDERNERQKLAGYIAQVSRALTGNELADELMYSKSSPLGFLWKFRLMNRIEAVRNKLVPMRARDSSNLPTIPVFDGAFSRGRP